MSNQMYKKCMRIVLALALLAGVAVFAYTYGMALSEGVLIDKADNYYVKGHKKQYEKCGLRFLQRLFVADPLLAQVDPEVGVKEFIAAKSWFEANGYMKFAVRFNDDHVFNFIEWMYGENLVRVGVAKKFYAFFLNGNSVEYGESPGNGLEVPNNLRKIADDNTGGIAKEVAVIVGEDASLPEEKIFLIVTEEDSQMKDILPFVRVVDSLVTNALYMVTTK